MASYSELIALIDAYINQNGVQAITGQVLNGVLKAMVDQLGRGYALMGVAQPGDDPGTPDAPESWFASTPGTYTDFGGLVVADAEFALLSYTPSTLSWSKTTLTDGIKEVQASVDANVGTPAVTTSYEDGVLTFTFSNMKGNTGDAAGFGTVAAQVDANIGTPGVTVETSGPNTAKNIAFKFTNLKGETGVTSVVATVDNTSGNPQCAVSLVGQQLTLAFTGLKGAQGDTGSSVDYPFTIVNNLTTNDATQALSAAMGVQLEGEISQLEAEVDAVVESESTISPNIFDKSSATSGKAIRKDTGALYTDANFYYSDYIEVPDGATSLYYSPGQSVSGVIGWAFYNDSKQFTHGGANYQADVETGDAYFRFSIRATKLDTTMLVVGTSANVPGHYVPYGVLTNYSFKDNLVDTRNIVDRAVTEDKLAKGVFNKVDYHRDLSDALLAIRADTSSYSCDESQDGTRIRIIFWVRNGERIVFKSTDVNGAMAGIWDSIGNAIYSSSDGKLQSISSYTTDEVDAVASTDGYLCISLTNGNTAITDEKKAQMLEATTIDLYYDTSDEFVNEDNRVAEFVGDAIVDPGKGWYVIRVNTNGTATLTDNPAGNRLRVICPVKRGDVVWASTSDAGGVYAGIWNTALYAARGSANYGRLEYIGGYFPALFHIARNDGYVAISLTNGSSAISDELKSTMLSSLRIYVGSVGAFISQMLPAVKNNAEHSDKYTFASGNYYGERPSVGKYHVTRIGGIDTTSGWVDSGDKIMQGMGCGDGFVFWGSSANDDSEQYIFVIDVANWTMLKQLSWNEVGTWHMNNINVSGKFDTSDIYPLIYLSECRGEHRCAVVRFSNDLSSYSIVQTIKFDDASNYFLSSHDWFIDEGQGTIYAFGTSSTTTRKFRVVKFALPSLANPSVSFNESDIVDEFEIQDVYTFQGSVAINGRLYIPYGYGTATSLCRMKIVDLRTHESVTDIPLYDVFGNTEIESVSPFENGLLLASGGSNSGVLYKIVFD